MYYQIFLRLTAHLNMLFVIHVSYCCSANLPKQHEQLQNDAEERTRSLLYFQGKYDQDKLFVKILKYLKYFLGNEYQKIILTRTFFVDPVG